MTARSRLQTPAQFGAIVLKSDASGARCACRTWPPSAWAPETYDSITRFNGKPRPRWASSSTPTPTRWRPPRRSSSACSELKQYWPHGYNYHIAYSTTPFVTTSIEEVVNTLIEAVRAGGGGDVPVPAELARHADPDHRRAGGADGHLRRAGRVRLFDQHPDHVRDGAGDRPAGGRCHRGGGERRARHEPGRPAAQGGHAALDAADRRRAGRHRAGADRGVRADGVLQRRHRRDLPAVLDHHRRLDDPVGAGGHDPDTRAVRDHPHAAAPGEEAIGSHGRLGRFFRWFNTRFRQLPSATAGWSSACWAGARWA